MQASSHAMWGDCAAPRSSGPACTSLANVVTIITKIELEATRAFIATQLTDVPLHGAIAVTATSATLVQLLPHAVPSMETTLRRDSRRQNTWIDTRWPVFRSNGLPPP